MILTFSLVLMLTPTAPLFQAGPDRNWTTYSNAAYGYEILFPAEFEARPTGPEGERDGRSLRIARKEYAAPVPVLDLYVGSNAVSPDRRPEGTPRDMERETMESHIGVTPSTVTTLRWKATGEIAFMQISAPGVVFILQPGAGVKNVTGTIWWDIVSSFRLVKR
jgi:hypothetical protein